MTEEEARAWVRTRFDVSRETQLERYAQLITTEAANQNLVSASSLDHLWSRHITDSAQLVPMADAAPGLWIDIGSGAGLPGMVVAILTDRPVTLVEPRKKRAAFLAHVVEALALSDRVHVAACRIEQLDGTASVISARAVALLPALLRAAVHLSTRKTLWLLPKGHQAPEEVAAIGETWHGSFHVEHSITEPGSLIITARGVARR